MLEIGYDVLDRLVTLPSKIVDEVKWELDDKGVNIKVVDPAHVALGDIVLDSDAFESYDPNVEEVGLNCNQLNEFIGIVDKDETIKIELGDNIKIEAGNIERKMPALDISSMTEPSIPSLDLPSMVKLEGSELKRGAKATGMISDQIKMNINNDGFIMSIEKDENSIEVDLEKDKLEEHDCGELVKSQFALDYFSDMVRAIGKNDMIELRLGVDYPFKLMFHWADGLGTATYLLAPRIEDV